jgi:outer membrane protein OmpA-like peptidoglycan-associated protein
MAHARATQASQQQAADALASLSGVATVTQEHGGTVITLSDAVLFPTDGDTLSPDAHNRLDTVANALKVQPSNTRIRVEGHTDTTGTTETNDALSQRRADAVRDYLAQAGVDSSMLQSIGRGEADPVATNATEAGRASNRRADIVVKLPPGQTYPGIMQKPGRRPNSSAKMPPPEPQPNEMEQPQPFQQAPLPQPAQPEK